MNQMTVDQVMASQLRIIELKDLHSVEPISHASAIYQILSEPLPYAFFLKKPIPGRPLIIFGQGDQNRKTVTLPRFQRMDWAEKLDFNILIFSDPTLHLSADTGLGWLLGSKDHYVLINIKSIIESIRDSLCLKNRNLLFYGSSAGGFTSLMLSSHFEGSSSLVNNPQTDVLNFTMGGVQNLLKLGFDGISREIARDRFGDRMSFIERVRQNGHIPNIYYLQNLLDEHHYRDHMLPLIETLYQRFDTDKMANNKSRLILDLYCDAKARHNPVGFEKIKSCIDKIHEWIE